MFLLGDALLPLNPAPEFQRLLGVLALISV
jgi:hypothetical protein